MLQARLVTLGVWLELLSSFPCFPSFGLELEGVGTFLGSLEVPEEAFALRLSGKCLELQYTC